MTNNLKSAQKAWELATQNLAGEFVKKHFEGVEWRFVNDDIGGVLEINDYYFSLGDIVEYIRQDATTDEILDHFDYCLRHQKNYKFDYWRSVIKPQNETKN